MKKKNIKLTQKSKWIEEEVKMAEGKSKKEITKEKKKNERFNKKKAKLEESNLKVTEKDHIRVNEEKGPGKKKGKIQKKSLTINL